MPVFLIHFFRQVRKPFTIFVSLLLTGLAVFAPGAASHAKEMIGAHSPVWSPDGRRLVYVLYHDSQPDLVLLDVGSFTATRLVENAGDPAWSPDGRQIGYTSYAGGNVTISSLDLASGRQAALTIGYSPQWSPDGQHLAYLVSGTLHLTGIGGVAPRRPLTDASLTVLNFQWSPNGKVIAFFAQLTDDPAPDYYSSLYLMNADGSGLHKIVGSKIAGSLAWSPTGDQLAFTGTCGPNSDDGLCLVSADGSHLRWLAPGSQPSWSSDGRSIVYTLNDSLNTIRIDGAAWQILIKHDALITDTDATWSPDGQRIVFARMHNLDNRPGASYKFFSELYLINLDGSALRALPDGVETF